MKGSVIQSAIEQLLYYDHWLVIRVNQGAAVFDGDEKQKSRFVRFAFWSMLGHEWQRGDGISDLLAFKNGVFLAIEVKGDSDRERPGQSAFLTAAKEAGAVCIVARGAEDVEMYLSERIEVQ